MIGLCLIALYVVGLALFAEVVILNLLMVLGLRRGFGEFIIYLVGASFVPVVIGIWIWFSARNDNDAVMLPLWALSSPIQFAVSVLGLFLAKKIFAVLSTFRKNNEKSAL